MQHATRHRRRITLSWTRGKRSDTAVAKRLIYESHCGRFCMIRSDLAGYGVRWQVLERDAWGWHLLGLHRTRHAAEARCRKAARRDA